MSESKQIIKKPRTDNNYDYDYGCVDGYAHTVPTLPLEMWNIILIIAIESKDWIECIRVLLCTSKKIFDLLIAQRVTNTISSLLYNGKEEIMKGLYPEVIGCSDLRRELRVRCDTRYEYIREATFHSNPILHVDMITDFDESLDASQRIIIFLTPGLLKNIQNERIKLTPTDMLDHAVDLLIKDFDEEKAKSAIMVKKMSETLLAYIEQKERWDRGERYCDPEYPDQPEEPIEFETDADMWLETLYIIPYHKNNNDDDNDYYNDNDDEEEIEKKIRDLIKIYMPEWSKRIIFEHVTRD